jgi:hypothetical protein
MARLPRQACTLDPTGARQERCCAVLLRARLPWEGRGPARFDTAVALTP